jgi:hypothetical protein
MDPTARKERGLRLRNKQALLKYREVFGSKIVAHNIFNWCQALWDSPAGADILTLQTELVTINREVTKAALQAEHSTTTRTFGYAWSPTLAEAGQCVTFWRNCLQAAKHHQDPFSTLVPSQLQHHGIKHAGLNLAFYKSRLDDAWFHLLMVQDNSQELQKSFLLTLLSNAKIAGKKTEGCQPQDNTAGRIHEETMAQASKIFKG